jgi:hypothetical protein
LYSSFFYSRYFKTKAHFLISWSQNFKIFSSSFSCLALRFDGISFKKSVP